MDTTNQSTTGGTHTDSGVTADLVQGPHGLPGEYVLANPGTGPGNVQTDADKRAKWKAQKAAQRARKKSGGQVSTSRVEPPALPAMVPGQESPIQAEGGTLDPDEIVTDLAVVDWTPEEIKEISDEIIDGLDESDKASMVKLAVAGHLPEEVVKQIEADAGMPKLIKKFLKLYLPKLIAKKLNDAKISAEGKETAVVVGSLGYYVLDRIATRRRVEKLIKQNNSATPNGK